MAVRCFTAELTKEGQEPKTKHVKRSQKRGEHADGPESPGAEVAGECPPKDLVLGEEPRQRKNARDRECGYGHRPERAGDVPAQTTHASHVLFATKRVNDRPCREE